MMNIEKMMRDGVTMEQIMEAAAKAERKIQNEKEMAEKRKAEEERKAAMEKDMRLKKSRDNLVMAIVNYEEVISDTEFSTEEVDELVSKIEDALDGVENLSKKCKTAAERLKDYMQEMADKYDAKISVKTTDPEEAIRALEKLFDRYLHL